MKLYWGSGSAVSWRARLALVLKGLEHESHRLDLSAREHRGDAFLAINPRGTFPVLVDGEVVVRDSIAIIAYLERLAPVPALLGTTAAETGAIWQAIAEHDEDLGAPVNTVTRALFREDGLADPEPARAAVDVLAGALQTLEEALGSRSWLIGAAPSAADVVTYPTVHRLLRAASKPRAGEIGLDDPLAPCPRLGEWVARMGALPGVDDTYPPHWREG